MQFEYCHASEQWQYVRFTVDHVMTLSLCGAEGLENRVRPLLDTFSGQPESHID